MTYGGLLYNPRFMAKRFTLAVVILCAAAARAQSAAASPSNSMPPRIIGAPAQSELLWQKLDATVQQVNRELDGTMGVAIMDLADGRTLLLNPDAVFAQASSIKVTVLAELYRQEQGVGAGNAKLNDLYTVNAADIVADSFIMAGLTPGVTRVTNRDLATFMVAVSDNSATNVLIDHVGMQNVNAMLDTLGLSHTRLKRKMMDVKAAQVGRENLSTPRDMMTFFADLYQGKVLNKALTADYFKVLSTPKQSDIPRFIPDDIAIANKPGELAGVRNDMGVVFAPNRPFVIVVMTAYLEHEHDGNDAIARIARAAYEYFDRVGRSSEYGRIVNERNSH
jgi:beta-lactamase class A